MYEVSPTPSRSLSFTKSYMMLHNEFNAAISQHIFSQRDFTIHRALTNQNSKF